MPAQVSLPPGSLGSTHRLGYVCVLTLVGQMPKPFRVLRWGEVVEGFGLRAFWKVAYETGLQTCTEPCFPGTDVLLSSPARQCTLQPPQNFPTPKCEPRGGPQRSEN